MIIRGGLLHHHLLSVLYHHCLLLSGYPYHLRYLLHHSECLLWLLYSLICVCSDQVPVLIHELYNLWLLLAGDTLSDKVLLFVRRVSTSEFLPACLLLWLLLLLLLLKLQKTPSLSENWLVLPDGESIRTSELRNAL